MTNKLHIGELIKEQLATQERSANWLAKRLSINPSVLCRQIQKENINVKALMNMAFIMDFDFFEWLSDYYKKNKALQNQQ